MWWWGESWGGWVGGGVGHGVGGDGLGGFRVVVWVPMTPPCYFWTIW